jgi:hypothetical protein
MGRGFLSRQGRSNAWGVDQPCRALAPEGDFSSKKIPRAEDDRAGLEV